MYILVDVVSVPLTEGNNQNFVRGSLTKLSFFKAALGLLRQYNKSGATEDNNRKFSRRSPTELFFIFNFFDRRGIIFTN